MSDSMNKDDKNTPTSGNTPEDFGYTTPEGDKKPEAKPEGELDIANPATGYVKPEGEGNPEKKPEGEGDVKDPATGYAKPVEGDPEKKPVEGDPEKKPEGDDSDPVEKTEDQLREEFNSVLGDLPEDVKKNVSDFAVANKMTKEQVDAYAKMVKSNAEAAVARNEKAIADQRAAWQKELLDDKDFGGDNFERSVKNVERVLDKYLPNMKKVLTEKGTMLPPYMMRDLLALSNVLNPVAKFENGDPSTPPKKEKNFLDEMYGDQK